MLELASPTQVPLFPSPVEVRIIQREDLEFSVGSKATVWEVKDPLLAGGTDYGDEDSASNYTHGGPPASLVGGLSGKQLYGNGGRGYPPPMERF